MRYKIVIPTFCIFSTLSLFAEENKVNDLLEENVKKKVHLTSLKEKKAEETTKNSRFIFKNTRLNNTVGSTDENKQKKVSKKYVYENKSRFKFQFTPGKADSNMLSGEDKGYERH